jgi:hypothetical protein
MMLGLLPLAFVAYWVVPAKVAGGAPPGNNGHIQIDGFVLDQGNNNDPMVGCGFAVDFFGYDAGTQNATITLTPQAPTSGGTPFTVSTSWTTATFTGGNQLDQTVLISAAQITAAFAGVAPAAQGFHAKLEVEVTGATGSDDKFHTIWMSGCSTPAAPPPPPPPPAPVTPPPAPVTPPPAVTPPVTGDSTSSGTTAGSADTPAATSVDTPAATSAVPATGASPGSSGSVAAAAPSTSTGPVATAGSAPAVSTAAVAGTVIPTGAPHTGFGGAARSPNTLLITLGALLLVAAALVPGLGLRRRLRDRGWFGAVGDE